MAKDPFSDDAAEDFLSGGGISAQWPTVGFVVEGTITGWSMQHQKGYESGEPLYWVGKTMTDESKTTDHSSPVRQLVLEIEGEPTGVKYDGTNDYAEIKVPDDDGARVVYVKGALQKALKDAIKTAGGKLEVGAHIQVKREKDGPKTNARYKAPHRYSAVWVPAAQNPKALAAQGIDENNPFG